MHILRVSLYPELSLFLIILSCANYKTLPVWSILPKATEVTEFWYTWVLFLIRGCDFGNWAKRKLPSVIGSVCIATVSATPSQCSTRHSYALWESNMSSLITDQVWGDSIAVTTYFRSESKEGRSHINFPSCSFYVPKPMVSQLVYQEPFKTCHQNFDQCIILKIWHWKILVL